MGGKRKRRHDDKRDRRKRKRKDDDCCVEVEQFAIHEPERAFAIAKHNSAAAASNDDEALAQNASGDGAENDAED